MDWVTDKKFLVGLALGFFILPRVVSTVRGRLAGMGTAPAA